MKSLVETSHRRLRLASVSVLVGVAALGGVAAWNPVTSAGSVDSVSFTGGCGLLGTGLGASSSPDTSQLSVPAGGRVEFANRLEQPAELWLDGEPVVDVPAGGAEEVTFFEGPVTAAMRIDCALGKPSGSVTVEVLPDAAAGRAPAGGAPATTAAGQSPAAGDGQAEPGSDSDRATRSPLPTTQRPASSAGRTTHTPDARPAPSTPGDQPSGGPAPDGGGAPGQPSGGTQNGAGPAGSESDGGWWPGSPSEPGSSGPAGAAPDTGDAPGGADSGPAARPDAAAPDAGAQSGVPERDPAGGEVAPEEITHAADTSVPGGSIGLLALIATVCVVGVSAGAIRAILTQRSSRAEWA